MSQCSRPNGSCEDVPAYPLARDLERPLDPPPGLAGLGDAAPLLRVRIWDGSMPWLVTRYADQCALLADPRVSADMTRVEFPHRSAAVRERAGRVHSFMNMDDPEHARLRRMVNAPFTARRVESMRPAIRKIVDEVIDELLRQPKPADLMAWLALPVPSLVICQLLGVPAADQEFFQLCSRTLADPDADAEVHRTTQIELLDYLDRLVERKLAVPDGGLMSQLVTERLGTGELTRRETAVMGMLLLAAGHETTTNMIGLGTVTLLSHFGDCPDQRAILTESSDPRRLTAAIEELFRYITVVEERRRFALEDIEIAGEIVRAGDGLIMPVDAADRDPAIFSNPDQLDLGRRGARHLALGYGSHQCLGQHLARVTLEIVFATLFRRAPGLSLAADITEMSFKTAGLRGVHEIPVSW